MIAEITIKRLDTENTFDNTLQIAIVDSRNQVKKIKTIGHKIGCNEKTILVELDHYESVRVTSVKR